MKSNKEPVKLREKKLSNGQISLYLDKYKDGKRAYEFLKLYLIEKPKSPLERQLNKTNIELAQRIKAKRIEELNSHEFDFQPKFKTKTDFIAYYSKYIEEYTKKDKRTLLSSFNQFKKYSNCEGAKDQLPCREISENLVLGFKNFLETNFSGETPQTYFSRFRKVIKQAIRDKIFIIDPIPPDLKFKADAGLKKGILSFEELQILANTRCPNEIVKRAFLFCCNTGLRHCDLILIKWSNIDKGVLRIYQTKTAQSILINLNSTALKLIGIKSEQDALIFPLPSFTGSIKSIRKWCKAAGIDRRITWHSARHSFATNLLIQANDVKTVSELLGHTSLKHTEKYLRVVKALKDKAVNSLPEIDLL